MNEKLAEVINVILRKYLTIRKMDLGLARELAKADRLPSALQKRLWEVGDLSIKLELAGKEKLCKSVERSVLSNPRTASRYLFNPNRSSRSIKKILKHDLSETDYIQIASQDKLSNEIIVKILPKITPMVCYTLLGNKNTPNYHKKELAARYVSGFKFRPRYGKDEFKRFGDALDTWVAIIRVSCWFQLGVVRYALDNFHDRLIYIEVAKYLSKLESCQNFTWLSYGDGEEAVSRAELEKEADSLLAKLAELSFGDKEICNSLEMLSLSNGDRARKALLELKKSLELSQFKCESVDCEEQSHITYLEELGMFSSLPKNVIKAVQMELLTHRRVLKNVREGLFATLRGEDTRALAKKLIKEKNWSMLKELILIQGPMAIYKIEPGYSNLAALELCNLGYLVEIEFISSKEVRRKIIRNYKPAKDLTKIKGYREEAVSYIESLGEDEKDIFYTLWQNWDGSLDELLKLHYITKL
jgi:hypothetical protein